MKTRTAGLLLFLTFCAVATGRNVVIVNPVNKPVPIKNAGAPVALATPTASPAATATNTPTPTPAGFDPSTIAGLQAWWKADSLSLADGAPVASWPDSTSHGNAAVQTTPANQPLFHPNAIGAILRDIMARHVSPMPTKDEIQRLERESRVTSHAALEFGTNAYFNLTTALPSATRTTFAVILVETYSSIGSLGSGSFGPWSSALLSPSGPVLAEINDGSNKYQSPASFSGWTFYYVTSSSAPAIWVNGASQTLTLSAYAPGVNDLNLMGVRNAGDMGGTGGYIAEILYYNTVVSDTDRQNVENYLKTKYALP